MSDHLGPDDYVTEPYPVPPDASAIRMEWHFLPPTLRTWIERKCGSPVAKAISQDAGFTPGLASVLVCEDGSRHFVKAASAVAQRASAEAYREEARTLATLPPTAPAPRLKWHLDDDWVVLGIEYVAGQIPARPWSPEDLDALLDALEVAADVLTPSPARMTLAPAETEFAPLVDAWDLVRRTQPDLPHLDEAAALAERFTEVCAGDSVIHGDIRADNILITADGSAQICDWNWPARGCNWFDSVAALIGPRGDGIDVEPYLTERRLLRDVPTEAIDIVLALHAGYFLGHGAQRPPKSSPHLREAQLWQGQVCWNWLSHRRGWS